jgi:hypothetical protein
MRHPEPASFPPLVGMYSPGATEGSKHASVRRLGHHRGAGGVAAAVAGIGSQHQAARARGLDALKPMQKRLVSGVARRALEQRTAAAPQVQRSGAAQKRADVDGCPVDRGSNLRVNQDCLNQSDPDLQGRGQAQNETAIAQDPTNPSHMVAASNDYRRDDSGCYPYRSSDSGRTWHDAEAPVGFTRGDAFGSTAREYWQASGDPSVAWDTRGNAYLSCLTFNRGPAVTQNPDASSAFYVFRSTGTDGASWNFPGRPVDEFNDPTGEGATLLDKPYIGIDDHRGSPFRDRVYVTWTRFDPDGTAYIYGAYSRDHGESFSTPKLVSTTSDLCSNTQGTPTLHGACNINQFSQPFTAPDGTLYVVYDNYNLTGVRAGEGDQSTAQATDNRAQVLLAKSTDGGNTFSAPVKVADYYELPDCQTYQGANEGVACVPEKGRRRTRSSVPRTTPWVP